MKRLLIAFGILLVAFGTAEAQDCITVELGAEVIASEPHDVLSLYFATENCGAEPDTATFDIMLSHNDVVFGTGYIEVITMPAGELFEYDVDLPIIDIIPAGVYKICVVGYIGEAAASDCASITLNAENEIVAFTPLGPLPVGESSWGAIKAINR